MKTIQNQCERREADNEQKLEILGLMREGDTVGDLLIDHRLNSVAEVSKEHDSSS